MKKYKVNSFRALDRGFEVYVDADNEDDAIKKAFYQIYDDPGRFQTYYDLSIPEVFVEEQCI